MGWEERVAERVLDDLQIVDAADLRLLDEIAYMRGAIVCERCMRGAEARLTVVGQRAIIAISPAITQPRRRRFSIAHELGHFEMHRSVSSLSLCTQGDLEDWRSGQAGGTREQEANGFAAALLMPRRFFAPRCHNSEPSLECVEALAQQFDTSLTATALRYIECSDEAVAVVVSHHGVAAWYRASREFEEMGFYVEVKCRLAPNSHAYAIHQSGVRSPSQRRVRADAWLAEGGYRLEASLLEQTWLLSESGSMLTLLWVDDDIGTDQYYWSED